MVIFSFHTIDILPRGLLATRCTFVECLWFVSWCWTRIRRTHQTSKAIFMEVAVPLIYGAWLLFGTTSIVIPVIFIPGIWIAPRISFRVAVDSRSFIIRSILYWDNVICYKAWLAKYYMYMRHPDLKIEYLGCSILFEL